MSEPAAPPAKAPGGKKENVFTHRLGPLPMWGWVAGAAAILVAWRLYSSKKNGSSAGTSKSGSGGTGLAGGASPYDIPQFVNQTYTTVGAPPAPTYTHPRDHDDHDHDHPDWDRDHDRDDHHHPPGGTSPWQPGGHLDHDHDDQDRDRDRRGGDPDRDRGGRGGGFGGGGGRQDGRRHGQHWAGQWHRHNSPSSQMHGDHASRGGGSGRYGRDY